MVLGRTPVTRGTTAQTGSPSGLRRQTRPAPWELPLTRQPPALICGFKRGVRKVRGGTHRPPTDTCHTRLSLSGQRRFTTALAQRTRSHDQKACQWKGNPPCKILVYVPKSYPPGQLYPQAE